MEELDKTSEKIVKATLIVLQREGFQKATTKKIAAEAGVNELTIFRKFENKANLVEATKKYHLDKLINKLDEVFDYSEDEDIEVFLRIAFYGILSFSDQDFSIIRVAMEEVRTKDEKRHIISEITDVILDNLEEFFDMQKEQGKIRDVNTRSLAVMCFSVLFQSVILWKIYDHNLGFDSNPYADDILDMLFRGILVEE